MQEHNKKLLLNRLNRIEGQIRGLKAMVENKTYCINVITQTSAVKQALSAVENLLMENHLSGCILKQIKTGQEKKAKDEILKVYKLKRK